MTGTTLLLLQPTFSLSKYRAQGAALTCLDGARASKMKFLKSQTQTPAAGVDSFVGNELSKARDEEFLISV